MENDVGEFFSKITAAEVASKKYSLEKRSENMQQIYRKAPMLKCDFNKVALQIYQNHASVWVFSCKFAAYFQNTFSEEHPWAAASAVTCN